ncbi:DNA helicase [Tanacetum coccineum]
MDYVRTHQNDIQSDHLLGLYDAIGRGDLFGIAAGNLQFFITFTGNVNWPAIKRDMAQYPEITPANGLDIVCRVFEQKVKDSVRFFREVKTFGEVTGLMYTIEYDNAWTLWRRKLKCTVYAKSFVQQRFSKKYNNETFFDDSRHAHYRRRDTDIHTLKHESSLDNCYVVRYNRDLCLAFQAHINVEYCGWSMLIKYLFKYISKGPDRIFAKISKPIGEASTSVGKSVVQIDEIHNFVVGHFICPHEACWRILDFPIHSREPAVQIMSVHLEYMQRINHRERLSKEYRVQNIRKQHLLNGCNSPLDVRTVNNQLLPTYRAACEALGLLGDDRVWDIALEEATFTGSSSELRKSIRNNRDSRLLH